MQVEPLCDVCNGKMSLETFVNFKISKETGAKKTDKRSRSRYDTQPMCTQPVLWILNYFLPDPDPVHILQNGKKFENIYSAFVRQNNSKVSSLVYRA